MPPIRMRWILALGILSPGLAAPAAAQERSADGAAGRFAALDELDASYRRQLHDLECRHIDDLATLAEKSLGPEADAAYRQLFGLAITRGLCREAQTAGGTSWRRARGTGRSARWRRSSGSWHGPTGASMTGPSTTGRASSSNPPARIPTSRWPSARHCSSG